MSPDERALLAALASGVLDPGRPRQRLLDHVSGAQPFAGFVDRLADLFAIDAADARRLLAAAARPDGWRPLLPGLTGIRATPGAGLGRPGVEAALIRLEAGGRLGHHGHGGDETTLVLQGGFADDLTGRHLGPGDTLHLAAGTSHSLRVDPGEACLAAVLLLGPLRP